MIISIDIDAQKTFTPLCPNELPIIGGDEIADELNAQAQLADLRVMTKDAHSPHAKWITHNPSENGQLMNINNNLINNINNIDRTWLPHAIVGTYGYELLDNLPAEHEYDFCVFKGISPDMHPYGACFHDLQEKLSTGLFEWLVSQRVEKILIGGLATDYCVKTTVLQLIKLIQLNQKNKLNQNIQIIVNRAACRGISPETSEQAWQEMAQAGAIILDNTLKIKEFLKK